MHYRGEGFGYDVIETVQPFLDLTKNVEFVEDVYKRQSRRLALHIGTADASFLFGGVVSAGG